MKRCPACQRTYEETNTFCIEDGTVLIADYGETSDSPSSGRYDPPPTQMYMPPTEVYDSSPQGGSFPPSSSGGSYNPPYAPPTPSPGYGPGPGSWTDPPTTPRNYSPPPAPSPYTPPRHPAVAGGQDQSLAIASLACGALSFVCFGPLTSIPAVILGVMARNRVQSDPQRYGGQGLATAGMILGGINLALVALYVVVAILGALAR